MSESQPNWTSLELLERYQSGDDLAAEDIFSRYFTRLISLARSRLTPRLTQRIDAEDIVLSVYRSFFVDAREGRYLLSRGGDLWRLLAAMTRNKLLHQIRSQTAGRRSIEREVSLETLSENQASVRNLEPTPQEAAELTDELAWIFSQLDSFARRVLELRLQGLQLSEIAQETGRSERSVRRSLAEIRGLMMGRFDAI
jgi:RNA polymerase sigma factor (sigma-70 family)